MLFKNMKLRLIIHSIISMIISDVYHDFIYDSLSAIYLET